jgi:hypothetical protein
MPNFMEIFTVELLFMDTLVINQCGFLDRLLFNLNCDERSEAKEREAKLVV